MTANYELQSPGQKLHLLRLSIGWSEQECAYRLTLEANELITTDTWLNWEQSGLRDPQSQEIRRLAGPICKLFTADENWLLSNTSQVSQSATILPMKR
jgi:transcriptional regulator with XRE-family HTH domain|tara:strand:+ start:284 stop:577 length:294 start_codon:yes stop_codon:yes gene_type:complete